MIKARVRNDKNAIKCDVCGKEGKKCLDIFELMINDEIRFMICDLCNDELFTKTLKAESYTNGRIKTKEDMAIVNSRIAMRKNKFGKV